MKDENKDTLVAEEFEDVTIFEEFEGQEPLITEISDFNPDETDDDMLQKESNNNSELRTPNSELNPPPPPKKSTEARSGTTRRGQIGIPDFTFDIKPGLEVKNAFMTDEEISYEDSIFSKSQYLLIDKMLNDEINKLNDEFKEKLDSEKRTAWQNGNQAGIKQTQNQLLGSVQTVIEQLEQLIKNLTGYTEVFMEHYEQHALKLMIKIARKVIDAEVLMNPEIILNNLKKSLELLNEKEEIKILVNPIDLEKVNENINKLSLAITLPENIEIISNDSINAGGCKIDFKAGSIDADIDTQFEEIKRQLLKNE